MSKINRREFVASAAALGVVGLAGTALADETAERDPATVAEADLTYNADVVVVGLGTAGIMAAYSAAKAGAKVVAVDVAPGMEGTTNVNTTAPMAIGSRLQAEANPTATVSVKEAYQEIMATTHYQQNSKLLRAMLEVSGTCIDTMAEYGMPFMCVNSMADASSEMKAKTGCLYMVSGPERADVFRAMLSDVGVRCLFDMRAEFALADAQGTLAGIRCVQGRDIVDVVAPAVVLATGGFLGNEDKVKRYFGGAKVLTCGNANCKGIGIEIAQIMGAQLGKNFAVSMNEFGGANEKATPLQCAYLADFPCNGVLRLAIMGYPMVDVHGTRFMDEGIVCGHAMYTGEPLVREGVYYTVYDQALMDRVAKEPLGNFLNTEDPANVAGTLVDLQLSDIQADWDTAVAEGWAFKADTLEELAEHFGLENLPATIAEYNAMCAAGEDTLYFKEDRYMTPLNQPPFYIAQYQPSAWLSLGGIKTDEACRALTAEGEHVPGIFVAGADADLWAVPYVYPGSANGFALASGWIAGESAAAFSAERLAG